MTLSEVSIPDYWLPQPTVPFGESEQQACDALLADAVAQGAAAPFAYTLAALSIPKWRFLCYVAEQHHLALHGSGNGEIARFEPRQSSDLEAFGAQHAVYAASDGIWPIYFAIVDRVKSPTVMNGCIRVEEANGTLGAPHYFFSISKHAVAHQPYRNGMVYLLPRTTFVPQPPLQDGARRIHVAQLASAEAVAPLAKLVVTPEDFPFVAQMRTHDDARLQVYAEAMQKGLPWPES